MEETGEYVRLLSLETESENEEQPHREKNNDAASKKLNIHSYSKTEPRLQLCRHTGYLVSKNKKNVWGGSMGPPRLIWDPLYKILGPLNLIASQIPRILFLLCLFLGAPYIFLCEPYKSSHSMDQFRSCECPSQ
jgi:hypothetical protein